MARWQEVVRYKVVDLSEPREAIFLTPGFYWFIPLDGEQAQPGLDENHPVSFVGPFPTREAARDDALQWINMTLRSPDTHDMKDAA